LVADPALGLSHRAHSWRLYQTEFGISQRTFRAPTCLF